MAARFVIQKHAASRLHYDFRLEVAGVYRSWAVPKGPSTDPRKKRLAVEVEDHSIGWGEFEGVIEEGYGAGGVIVWDRGTYANHTELNGKPATMERGLASGFARFELHGEKLSGEFTLRRLKNKNWLLIKVADGAADPSDSVLAERPESIVSGRTIEEFSGQQGSRHV